MTREGLLEEKTEAKMNSSRYEGAEGREGGRAGRELWASCFPHDGGGGLIQ